MTTIDDVVVDRTHRCAFPAPARVWYQTPTGLWASREWGTVVQGTQVLDERKVYEAVVLGRGSLT